MQNNDLIPRKEVEKMIDEMIERGKGNNDILRYGNTVLRNLQKELSQIESVNGWIPIDKHPTERVIIRGIYEGEEFTATGKIDDDSYLDELGQRVAFAEYVTHYMPLPPTPNKV